MQVLNKMSIITPNVTEYENDVDDLSEGSAYCLLCDGRCEDSLKCSVCVKSICLNCRQSECKYGATWACTMCKVSVLYCKCKKQDFTLSSLKSVFVCPKCSHKAVIYFPRKISKYRLIFKAEHPGLFKKATKNAEAQKQKLDQESLEEQED